MTELPLALYIHIPWCLKKCPYCDFNSHQKNAELPHEAYVDALCEDLEQDLSYVQQRKIESIFFGGGTPSLLSSKALSRLMQQLRSSLDFASDIEVSLECNPGTAEYSDFDALLNAGVNRLSFGAQSFDDLQLQQLGRVHSAAETHIAVNKAKAAGFDNFNIDLMHSLPGQRPDDALRDIENALALEPTHLSWYQLTIEPNTAFHKQAPVLPSDDVSTEIYERGLSLLEHSGFSQYEISAYASPGHQARHNLNYWQFGDYLALGAGAHGKITDFKTGKILRYQKTRTPEDYLNKRPSRSSKITSVDEAELALEFMMNALRLNAGVPSAFFEQRCMLDFSKIAVKIESLRQRGLLVEDKQRLQCSELGRRWLNTVLSEFMTH
ncbi:radical SAM family heme chaperone HemW [Agaribacterium haliotis]|uniref:radical SAM family heme chaperone HemW n=1 Tax=Agaribacterium haliotis TaxID=2013869 RepID=UPI000BB53B89|nr:radical SAM family heme chaperone HemW [Agaribacterium haliotis]